MRPRDLPEAHRAITRAAQEMAMPTVAQAREAITTDARASVPERDRVRPVKVIDLRRLVHRSERSGSSNR